MKRELPPVMAFYHSDGFVPAWKQATRYAGNGGRLAVMPDVVDARLVTKPGQEPWEMYYTTLTAEYVGDSRGGNRILIVAHGNGPMATLDGILPAYSWQYRDKERNRRGGRIAQREFLRLESGAYGPVEVVDLTSYFRRYRYPFISQLRASQAATDPVLRARFGPRTAEYIAYHTAQARLWHAEQAGIDPENRYGLRDHSLYLDRRRSMHLEMAQDGSDPFLMQVGDDLNCSYRYYPLEPGYAFAHLISIGGLASVHHTEESERRAYESLAFDVSCHAWSNGVRLVAISKGAQLNRIHAGVNNVSQLVRRHWQSLLIPVSSRVRIGFRPLMQVGDEWFTQYSKNGPGLDTCEPEFHVTSIEPIGEIVDFVTPTLGYYGFFKYDIRGVRMMAPTGANAYALAGEPENVIKGETQRCPIQFYRVTADTTKRLPRIEQVENDYETLMRLLTEETP